ncbi:efflux RND transporter periplasmic adaptor subunit [Candidatus Pelagibacter sp.]|nr:efflux RND transporter periplasmic adaptor subunit [Candidatus Pelagibacter sp.]|tara:strand:- start:346 stop:1338 length:993 start_codon:yes stop_codon:yes gene_type:complete
MKRSTKITSIIIIFFLIITTVIVGRTMIGNHFKKKFSKRPPPGIIVTAAKERIFENIISTYGTAAPIQTQSFKIEKYEILKPIKYNQKVKKGDIIADLKNRKIIAQFDGILGKREFSEDLEVSKSSILINLEDTSSIYCDVDIPEIFVPFIKIGLPVDIKFSSYKDKIYEGKVDSFASRISEETRTLATRIKMDNLSSEILPGSFLEISIKYDVRESLSIPDTSTIVEGENVFIYKVNDKNKALKTKISIGDRYVGFVEVLAGINSGDKIVAEGTKKVRPNLTIRPIEKGSKKKSNSSWGKKDKSKKDENKKSKFDWIKKLNIFKKSESK